jgi:hypothetical protein
VKKVAVIFLTILYLIPSIGFSMDLHFCGDKISTVSMQNAPLQKCVCGKMSSSKCCKEIHVEVKLNTSQKASSTLVTTPKITELKLFINNIFSSDLFSSSLPKNSFVYFDPLRFTSLQKHPVYLTNSLLLL